MMSITKSFFFEHPVETVYEIWVSPKTVIPPATAMDIDPRVGGHYRLIVETEAFSTSAEGAFSIVEPGQRIVYSWQWSGSDEVTAIDVRFLREHEGCRIHLEHTGFLTNDSFKNHDAGWDSYAAGLARFIAASSN